MRFPFYKQPDSVDCGPTCLRMIALYYGKRVPLQLLRDAAQIGKVGSSLLGISESAESIGFTTHAVQLTYQRLVELATFPCILYWNQEHFVVLYKIRKKKLFVADPGVGLVTFTPEEFGTHWINHFLDNESAGIALLLEPSSVFYRRGDDNVAATNERSTAAKNIFRYLRPYRSLVFQILLGTMAGSLLQLMLPFLAQSIVDVGIDSRNIH